MLPRQCYNGLTMNKVKNSNIGMESIHCVVNTIKKWEIEMCIISWCAAMIRFNKEIQESVDWYHVFKYDE